MSTFPTPIATVDIVVLALRDDALHIGLITREDAPFAGVLALPGGYVHVDTDASLEDAVRRVLDRKTGLRARYIEQLGAFGGPSRDPRGWSLSVGYIVLVGDPDTSGLPRLALAPADALPPLPFDHADIVAAALARLRAKSSYSSLPAHLLGDTFTLAELQRVYERVLGRRLQKSPFRAKILDRDILEPVEATRRSAGRPAQLFRIRPGRATEFNGVI